MTKYRKKPVVIDAFQWTGDRNQTEDPEWVVDAICNGHIKIRLGKEVHEIHMDIYTLEGVMKANIGDYIIRGIQGEIYPCKPDIFEATYDNAFPKVNSSNIGRIVIPTRYIRDHTYAVMDLLRDVLIVEATTHFDGRTEYVGLSHKFKEVHPSCEAPIYGIDIMTCDNGVVEMKFQN